MLIWLSTLCILFGSILTFIAAWGVLRLPDFFMRMHAATQAGVVGPSLLLLGAGFYDSSLSSWVKICAGVLFLTMTTPIAGHLLGKAGFLGGVDLWGRTLRNDLGDILRTSTFAETETSTASQTSSSDTVSDPHSGL